MLYIYIHCEVTSTSNSNLYLILELHIEQINFHPNSTAILDNFKNINKYNHFLSMNYFTFMVIRLIKKSCSIVYSTHSILNNITIILIKLISHI